MGTSGFVEDLPVRVVNEFGVQLRGLGAPWLS